MSLKRHFLISAAAAVLSHQALGAAKPVIKYEVVEKFEVAPSDAEIRQAVLAFELAAQEKSKYNRTNLGKTLYLFLPHQEEKSSWRVDHFFCIVGQSKNPDSQYPLWQNITPDFKWFAVPKKTEMPEIEKLKVLEAAGYISVEEGNFNIVCPANNEQSDLRESFYYPQDSVRAYLHNVPAYRYALTDKALKEFFDDSPMWHIVFSPEEGVETYDADKVHWFDKSKQKTGIQPKPILERMHLTFPIGKIVVGAIQNIQKTNSENKVGNTIYTFEYKEGVEGVPAGLEKLLEIESPYSKKGENSELRSDTFALDALPATRLKDYPNTPLQYFTVTELKEQRKYRIAQDEKGQWQIEPGFAF